MVSYDEILTTQEKWESAKLRRGESSLDPRSQDTDRTAEPDDSRI